MLLVNYRGSTGAGQDSVDFLLGKVGTSDVSDCMLALREALQRFSWLNPKKVVLVGGSHGGFLVTHLSGQHPDSFRAVVARNPVIDIASMSIISDIPDWFVVINTFMYVELLRLFLVRSRRFYLKKIEGKTFIAKWIILQDFFCRCYVESGTKYTQIGEVSEEVLVSMRKASPIQHAHKVTAPTLLQVGSNDLRVPPSQATDYYHRLKANGVKVR